MVGGVGGSLNWFSWIAKSRGGFHGLSDLRLIVMGEITGTISGETTPNKSIKEARENSGTTKETINTKNFRSARQI